MGTIVMKSSVIKRCISCGRFLSEDDFNWRNKKKKIKKNACIRCSYNYKKLHTNTNINIDKDKQIKKLMLKLTGRNIKVDLMARVIYDTLTEEEFIEWVKKVERLKSKVCMKCGKEKLPIDFPTIKSKNCIACFMIKEV